MLKIDSYKTVVAIGTSTGGPRALFDLLTELPKDLPATYLIVQHMPAGFTKSLAERINSNAEINVKEAEDGELVKTGTAYIAPGGYHMIIVNRNRPVIKLTKTPPVKGHRPSLDILLDSLYKINLRQDLIGVIMTGMGSDGLEGLIPLKKERDIQVIAQNKESCVVYGMPRAVIEAGIANKIVPLNEIANEIIQYVRG